MKIVGIIPARYASTRFEGKPLADLCGKPVIQHVYERASQAKTLEGVIVATDDERIVRAVESFGGRVVMTSASHPSGTDRIAEVAHNLDVEIVVNVQGDQPLVEPDLIDDLVQSFGRTGADIVTPVFRISEAADLTDPGIAKVVRGHDGQALYFSRSAVPFVRDRDLSEWPQRAIFWGQYGIYGFRRQVLLDFVSLPLGQLEQAEKLEQLRFLEAGYQIYAIETKYRQITVDTVEDLERARQIMASQKVERIQA